VTPGFEEAIKQVEIFNPTTKTWRTDATMNRIRTYHNTATLLPDARVLIGGHAPLPWGYQRNKVGQDPLLPTRPYAGGQPNNQPSSNNDGRDPTFEIYTPPYLRMGVPQPSTPRTATCHPSYGGHMVVQLDHAAAERAADRYCGTGSRSTVNRRWAGVGSTTPAELTARTRKVCEPSPSGTVVCGELQGANAAPSTEHWKVVRRSVEEKAKVGVGSVVTTAGPELITLFG